MKKLILILMVIIMVIPMTVTAADGVRVGSSGEVAIDPDYDGPQITKIRVLNEGRFLEIFWDRYVDENEAVDPANFTLKAGDKTITLTPNTLSSSGWTDTVFFDRQNKAVASSDAHCMNRLDPDLHMSSISFPESELSKIASAGEAGLTLEVRGDKITDKDGKTAKSAVYTGVPRVDFYTQKVETKSGIIIKGDDTVKYSSLELAVAQVEVELGKPGTGIAETMKKWGCSLAVYSPHENVYMIPEHRYGFRTSMYDLEGYGGNVWNNCTSSIAEVNITRTRGETGDKYLNTMYPNENVLIHEFGHCVKSIGIEENPDQSYADAYFAAYENAVESGMWPNTYAISNSDEFFATMCAIWFNNMDDVSSWDDGTRSPLNTREEMKAYDPMTYAFFESILPSDETLPSPWDVPSPDNYHGEKIQPPKQNRFACDEDNLTADVFKLETRSRGSTWQVDRYAADASRPQNDLCLWTPYGTDGDASSMINGPWRVVRNDDGTICLSSFDLSAALTAVDAERVAVSGRRLNVDNRAQKWMFVEEPLTSNPYDGYLVSVEYGTMLAHEARAKDGTPLLLTEAENASLWMLRNTSETKGKREAFLTPTSETGEVPDVSVTVEDETTAADPETTTGAAETEPVESSGCGSALAMPITMTALAVGVALRKKRK